MSQQQIDQLRDLLGLGDRSHVGFVMLQGEQEVTNDRSSFRQFVPSGDVIVVIAGPRKKLNLTRTKATDGTVTYSFVIPAGEGL